jgi:hypothetical protein
MGVQSRQHLANMMTVLVSELCRMSASRMRVDEAILEDFCAAAHIRVSKGGRARPLVEEMSSTFCFVDSAHRGRPMS